MRRRRAATHLIRSQLTDENGQPVTFATPGAPTLEERRGTSWRCGRRPRHR